MILQGLGSEEDPQKHLQVKKRLLPDVNGAGARHGKRTGGVRGIEKGKTASIEKSKRQKNWPVKSLDESERFRT